MVSYYCIMRAREIAWHFSLPISLSEVCGRHGIELLFSDQMKAADACYFIYHGKNVITVNDNTPRGRQRFSIAHELGHFILGHGPVGFSMTEPGKRPPYQEVQANVFAAELLMPKSRLQHYGCLTPTEIVRLCDVSLEAAKIRTKEMGWLA